MASKAMRDRLAARLVETDDDAEGASVAGGSEDVSGLGGADESTSTDHITETPAGETAPEKVRVVDVKTPETPEQVEAKARDARVKLFEEKLAEAREKRAAARTAERAKAEREAAKAERDAARADREAAKAERGKYEGLRTGSFKETLAALGRDPAKTFEEMQREAIEASTPEAQARREREEREMRERERDAAIEERFKPVLSELEQLRQERAQWAADKHQATLHNSFQHAAADPAFSDLRIEYSDDALLEYARHYDKNPDDFRAAAHEYGVRLTAPEKGFTMHELLQLLSAAQAAHNEGVQARRAAQRPAGQQPATPTVNGTAPRRNAAATGTELASEQPAGAEDPTLSPRDRMRLRARAEIRRA